MENNTELTPSQDGISKEQLEAEMREKIEQEAYEAKCAAIKAKYPKAHELIVEDKRAFLKPMDRKILAMATSLAGGDEVQICELLLDACWIEGDEEIRADDEYFIPAMGAIKELMNIKKAMLKKL